MGSRLRGNDGLPLSRLARLPRLRWFAIAIALLVRRARLSRGALRPCPARPLCRRAALALRIARARRAPRIALRRFRGRAVKAYCCVRR
jgi:hypothetical protein